MRVFGENNPYERLKDLTRGKKITSEDFVGMISTLSKVPDAHKQRMKRLSCDAYTGMAERLVDTYFKTT